MAFWCRLSQSKLRQLAHHIPCASLLNPTVSKACVADNPLISHGVPTDFGCKFRFLAAPVQANSNSNGKKTEQGMNGQRLNQHIKANVVRLVMGEEHFVISKSEALERARNLELDLVEVQGTANPPVCKIMDYHKEKYKKETREKEQIKSKSKDVKTLRADSKEVKFSPKTEAKDLKMKADMVKRFMDKGYRVKCTASDSEGRDLGAVFSRLIALAWKRVELFSFSTPGRGKESFIMVRHVKFGPPKGGGKKTKAEDKKIPEKGSDGIGVTTRSDTVPLPPQESSGEAENRYRKIEARNQISPTREMDSKGETTNKGEPHMPYQRRETPTNSHFSPSMRDPCIPYQRREAPTNSHFSSPMRESNRAETTPSAFRNSAPLPNGIPKQEPSSPNPPRSPGLRQEPFIPNHPRSRSPGLGYGIFSTPTGNGSAKQGVSERVPAIQTHRVQDLKVAKDQVQALVSLDRDGDLWWREL